MGDAIHTKITRRSLPAMLAGGAAALGAPAPAAAAASGLPAAMNQRNEAYREELERYFRAYLVDEYPARAAQAWRRTYSSVGAFLRSVEPNRLRYKAMFKTPPFERSGPVE